MATFYVNAFAIILDSPTSSPFFLNFEDCFVLAVAVGGL